MKIDQDKVPSSLDQAVEMLDRALSEEDRARIRSMEQFSHHGFGTYLRNSWSLWDYDTPLSIWFQNNLLLVHGDDLYGVIAEALYARVRGEAFDPAAVAQRFIDHWKRSGCDPMADVERMRNNRDKDA